MRGTNGRFRSSFHRAVCRTTRNHRSMSKRHRLLSYDPRGVSKAPIFGDGRGRDDPFLVGQQRRIHRSREIAEHLGPYGRHIGSRGDAYRLPLSIEATRGSRLKSLTISSFGSYYSTLYFHSIFTLRLSNSSVSSRVRTPSYCRPQTIFFGLGLHSAHCRMGFFRPRLVPQMDRALQHTANFPAYLRGDPTRSISRIWGRRRLLLSFFSASNSCRHIWPVRRYSLIFASYRWRVYFSTDFPTPPTAAIPSSELSFPDWHRQVIWGFTVEVIKTAPVLGVGPNAINLLPGANELIPGMGTRVYPLSSPQLAARNWRRNGLGRIGLICHLSTYGSQNVRGSRYSSKCCGLGGDGIVRGVLGELACELFNMVSMVVGGLCRAPQFAIGNDGGTQENRRQRNASLVLKRSNPLHYSGVEPSFDLTTPRLERKRLYSLRYSTE